MAALTNFKKFAKYFPAPIRKAWGLFIDTILNLPVGVQQGEWTWVNFGGYVPDPGELAPAIWGGTPETVTQFLIHYVDQAGVNQESMLGALTPGDVLQVRFTATGVIYDYDITADSADIGDRYQVFVEWRETVGSQPDLPSGDKAETVVGRIPYIPEDNSDLTHEPTGFANTNLDSVITFDDVTRLFTITPLGAYYEIINHNVKTQISVPHSVTIPATEFLHHIYFDDDGVLKTSSTIPLVELIRDKVYVGNIYWSAADGASMYQGDERHGLMQWESHIQWHLAHGTLYLGGLTLGDMLVDQNGSLDTHVQYSVSNGAMRDEDVDHFVATRAVGDVVQVIAKTGVDGWYAPSFSTAPIVLDTGVPQFNEFTGGVWQQTPVPNNTYYLAHLFGCNDARGDYRVISIQGEAYYQTKAGARDGATKEISDLTTSGLVMPEYIAMATIIYQYKTTYTNSFASRAVSTETGDDYVNWLTEEISPGATPSAHPNLTNRDYPNQHPLSAITSPADVPYDMGDNELTSVGFVDFDLLAVPTHQEGRLHWDDDDGTLEIGLPGGSVNLQIGQEMVIRCRNVSGVTIPNGTPIYVTGAQANRPTIAPAKADSIITTGCVGCATEEILNNKNGYITSAGLVRDVDTASEAEGALIYLSAATAGQWTTTKPTAPNYTVIIGYVIRSHANEGIIAINPLIIPRLAGLSDVYGAPSDGDSPVWVDANSRFEMVDVVTLAELVDGMGAPGSGANFNNGAILYWSNKLGTGTLAGFSVNSSDKCQVHQDCEFDGTIEVAGNVYMENRNSISWRQVTGGGPYGWISGISVNASDEIEIGISGGVHTGINLNGGSFVKAGDLTFDNAKGIRGITTGAASRTILRLAAGNDVQVGNANQQLSLISDGEVDAGANDIVTTGDITSHESNIDTARYPKSMTLRNNVGETLYNMTCASDRGASCRVYYFVEAVDAIGNVQAASGYFSMIGHNSTAGTPAAQTTKYEDENIVSMGTLVITPFTSFTTRINCAFRATSSGLVSPTITGWFRAEVGGDQAFNWSI